MRLGSVVSASTIILALIWAGCGQSNSNRSIHQSASLEPKFEIRLGNQNYAVTGYEVPLDFFTMLKIPAYTGRVFRKQDITQNVVVLSYRLWQRLHSTDQEIVGKEIKIGNRMFTVIGVTPPSFDGSSGDELWLSYGRLLPRLPDLYSPHHMTAPKHS